MIKRLFYLILIGTEPSKIKVNKKYLMDLIGQGIGLGAVIILLFSFILIWIGGSVAWEEPNLFIRIVETVALLYALVILGKICFRTVGKAFLGDREGNE